MSAIISKTFNKHELRSISTQGPAKRLCKSNSILEEWDEEETGRKTRNESAGGMN